MIVQLRCDGGLVGRRHGDKCVEYKESFENKIKRNY